MPPPGVTVIGDLVHYERARPDHPGYDRQLTGQLHLCGADGEVLVTAYAIEDSEPQRSYSSIRSTRTCRRTGVAAPGPTRAPSWPGRFIGPVMSAAP